MNLMEKYRRKFESRGGQEAGRSVAYRVYSEILQAYLWVVDTDEDMKALKASDKVTEAIYTHDEIRKLKGIDKEALKAVHRAKEIFQDSQVETKDL